MVPTLASILRKVASNASARLRAVSGARRRCVFLMVLCFSVGPAWTAGAELPPRGWLFLMEIERGDQCRIGQFFFLEEYNSSIPRFSSQLITYTLKAEITHKDGSKKIFDSYPYVRFRGDRVYTEFSTKCEDFLYLDILNAVCEVHYLGDSGRHGDDEVLRNEECLGTLPKRVYSAGHLAPEDTNFIFPLSPPAPSE